MRTVSRRAATAAATTAATLHALARGSRLPSAVRELRDSEALSPAALRAESERRLRETIAYAYRSIPYYRRVMDERGLAPRDIATAADLERLPVLTKRLLKEHFAELQPARLPRGSRVSITSGSTGEPTRFLATRAMHDWHDAAKLRAWRWAGYALGTPTALLWGSHLDLRRFESLAGRLRRVVNRELLLYAHGLSDSVCRSYVERMRRHGVEALHGYPNSIYELARHCLERGVEDVRLRFVLTTAETLLPPRRAAIERAFGCPVFDYYGSREVSLVSQECAAHRGYHVSIDNGLLEIARDGRAVAPGESGDILVTDFRNRALPFLRYAVGDVARQATEPCGCGLPFPVFAAVEGRLSDTIRLRDGSTRSPLMMTSLIYPDPTAWGRADPEIVNLRQWQIVQESFDEFTVRLVLEKPRPPERYAHIARNFARYVSAEARVRIELVDSLPAAASGKRRPVISRVAEGPAPE
jgi:phenylacetate-CoA ligase